MAFHSILFAQAEDTIPEEPPDFFPDLNLDQVVEAITAGKQEYDLRPFFYTTLHDAGAIRYRQEVMQDLEDETLLRGISTFAEQMVLVRRYLALVEKLDYRYHKAGWFLAAAEVYCRAVAGLAQALEGARLRSQGLAGLLEYLVDYVASPAFATLSTETRELQTELSSVAYCVTIRGNTVQVRKYEGEADYSAEVERTFARFRQGEVKDYRVPLYKGAGMNYVEGQILDCVARLYPDLFARLDDFCTRHSAFLDETIRRFDREVQFYVAYLHFIAHFQKAGLPFCYPQVTTDKEIYARDCFDIALANRLVPMGQAVIPNDFYLQGPERVIVITGPNQGGKTTFARAFGQLHYLASIGCPVPGREARLFLYDRLLTHFEREEDIRNLRGKLQDDLVRIQAALGQATPQSILILNEIFASTTLQDAIFLSRRVMERIVELDLLCVWVTFLDELAAFGAQTVSMVSTVAPDNPAVRTFKIVRRPADGLAYALSIAEKHHVTYKRIMERIPR